MHPFHLAVPVHNLEICRTFYKNVLLCEEGRSDTKWVDFNLFGHQFVIHLDENKKNNLVTNPVDGQNVPIPHYGVVLPMNEWEALAARLKQNKIDFIVEPYVRFRGEIGEQATMFFLDPSGNALEFKAFKDINQLFAK